MSVKVSIENIHKEHSKKGFSAPEVQEIFRLDNIILTSEEDADLLISDHFNSLGLKQNVLLRKMIRYRNTKKYLLWTDEPRFSQHFQPYADYPFLPRLNVLNLYTGLVENNFSIWPLSKKLGYLEGFEFQARKIVALMIFRNNAKQWSLKYQGRELDLCILRTQIALEGHAQGMVDIYGQGWDPKIRKGVSRGLTNFREEKFKILSQYHFHLAFENTNFPYYCTEKIWQSIEGGCLPIYFGKDNAIYDNFPRDSFIDYCDFKNTLDMLNYVKKMSVQEFMIRFNRCIEAYNNTVDSQRKQGDLLPMWGITSRKIREIMDKTKSEFIQPKR